MSYINAERQGDDVLVWERTENGRETKTYRAPYYFYVKDPDEGTYKSMYGDKLSRLDFNTSFEYNRARQECDSNGIEMFESDIPVELKVLSEHYYDVPAPKLHVTFLDIEVDYKKDLGFASVTNPYAPINSVAMHHTHLNKVVVLAVPPKTEPKLLPGEAPKEFMDRLNEIAAFPDDVEVEVRFCLHEKALLIEMMLELEDSDVLCGWNSDFFDIPYIGKRLEKIGKRYFRMMSFPDARDPNYREVEVMTTLHHTLDLHGRISTDYMVLFKKYEMAERPSYKLEAIANEIVPDLPKLEYEGTLADLYEADFAWFVRYNIRDVEVLNGFEQRLGYVELANQMAHLSTGLFKHVTGTLKLAELATINYCHHKLGGLVVNDVHVPEEDAQIQGAFVLLPQKGLHEKVSSVDLASLYPSAIRSLNISPETIIGQLQATRYETLTERQKQAVMATGFQDLDWANRERKSMEVFASDLIASHSNEEITFTMENGKALTAPAKEFREAFLEKGWAVSGYGTVFDQNTQGIIPMILGDWYAQRKHYKKLMAQAKDAGDKMKAVYYDKLQYVYKIKLNSFYGALTNKYFRFYDLRMGESTTGTGRKVLMHQCAQACKVLDGEYFAPNVEVFKTKRVKGELKLSWHYGYDDNWSVVYGDTDSSYFLTHADDIDQAVIIGDRVATLINKSFQPFMKNEFLCTEGYDNIMQCEREVVSDRGIFVDKKRYMLHLVDQDGWKCDKLKVMGLDTKKTTLPKEVSIVLNSFIERFLKGEEWNAIEKEIVEYKEQIRLTEDIMSIGLPKGIKGIEKYATEYDTYGDGVRLPGHVAAGIHYNKALEEFNDKVSMPIMSGMKIKVFYITQKKGKFKSIAIPVDIEQFPEWFNEYCEVDRNAHIERLVDNPLGNIIKAIGEEVPSKQSLLVNELLEF